MAAEICKNKISKCFIERWSRKFQTCRCRENNEGRIFGMLGTKLYSVVSYSESHKLIISTEAHREELTGE